MRVLRLLLPVLLFVLTACGSTSTGLLDGTQLRPDPGTPGLATWSSGQEVRAERLLLDPVQVAGGGSPAERAALGAALRQVLIETCGAKLPVTASDGPGVVRVRAAVDGVNARNGLKTSLVFGDDLELSGASVLVELIVDGRPAAAFAWEVARAAETRGVGPRWGRVEEAFRAVAEQVLVRAGSGR